MAPEAAIHQKAGIFISAHGEATTAVPTAARFGSFNHKIAGTRTTEGIAAAAKAARHPYACATTPPMEKLSSMPTGTAIMNTAMARVRRCGETASPIQLI